MRFFLILSTLFIPLSIYGKDIFITGKVTDAAGNIIPGAKISMISGSIEFASLTGTDGTYRLKVTGIYSNVSDLIETGAPFPNPFTHHIYLPFIINSPGDVRFSVYSLSGKKIKDVTFYRLTAGSYRIFWGGCSDDGSPAGQGFYIYSITFKGKTMAGKLVKAQGSAYGSSETTLEQVMIPLVSPVIINTLKMPVITTVSGKSIHTLRLTDIVLQNDTTIDFEVSSLNSLPFRTQAGHIAMSTSGGYKSLILKGINLGSSPPGTFPGEIAYAISGTQYEKWIKRMADAGFNCIRIYTLHPPVFYEKLSNYNARHPDQPLFLFQGIWLDEISDASSGIQYDLIRRTDSFRQEIFEVIDCLHGKRNISFRPGKAYGNYITDVSQWTAGLIIGREISPYEVDSTNAFNPSLTSYSGKLFSLSGSSPTEVFVTEMLDETANYESQKYSSMRPVSISSWPTLDPLNHPTEIPDDEDKASFDITRISGRNSGAGIFATYHAYPYYPNFISTEPSYQTCSDDEGPNSYLGYLTDLKSHYSDVPLVIGEFGVPSSWGSAHQSFSEMNHGGYSEKQQGEKNLRLMNNILDSGCAGGFMFSWMDEWFKPTWIVQYLEAFGFTSEGVTVPTRQLWHNIVSPEQNFGLISFRQIETMPFIPYKISNRATHLEEINASHDNSFFYLEIKLDQNLSAGDSLMVAFDTYSSLTGESRLPGGKNLGNRSEFLLSLVSGNDTASFYVTEAYDMKGFTPRFNLSDPSIQKYKSIVTDGAPWVLVEWINDAVELTRQKTGLLPVENSTGFTRGGRSAAAWMNNSVKVRIPWTLLHFYDPTRMEVINGVSGAGVTYRIIPAASDGISVSVYYKGEVTDTDSRYSWESWLQVPDVSDFEKESFYVVARGLSLIPSFAE